MVDEVYLALAAAQNQHVWPEEQLPRSPWLHVSFRLTWGKMMGLPSPDQPAETCERRIEQMVSFQCKRLLVCDLKVGRTGFF